MVGDNGCVFCKIVAGEVPSEKVYEDDNFMGILEISPLAEGHTLIIPKNHYKTLIDIPATMGTELLEAIKKVSLKLIQDGKAETVNLMVVGEDVSHAHVHVIPRKKGDGIKPFSKIK